MHRRAWLFLIEEDGATTVDWVVLTAAVMLIVVVVLASLFLSIRTAGENIKARVEAVQPYTPATPPPTP